LRERRGKSSKKRRMRQSAKKNKKGGHREGSAGTGMNIPSGGKRQEIHAKRQVYADRREKK